MNRLTVQEQDLKLIFALALIHSFCLAHGPAEPPYVEYVAQTNGGPVIERYRYSLATGVTQLVVSQKILGDREKLVGFRRGTSATNGWIITSGNKGLVYRLLEFSPGHMKVRRMIADNAADSNSAMTRLGANAYATWIHYHQESTANDGIAAAMLDMEFYGLGLDYLLRLPERIRAVSAAEVQAAAQKYLPTDRYALVVAGP